MFQFSKKTFYLKIKKVLFKTKMFFSVITKKRWGGAKDENF